MMNGLNTYDFGARNYNPLLPMWDKVDPKAGDYPWISPYTYCMNNPMRIIDPVGMDIWELDKNGYLVNHKETDVADVFYFRENHFGGKGMLVLDFGTVEDYRPGKTNEGNVYQAYKIRGDENGQKLFEFMADHTGVEWSHIQLDEEGKTGLNYVTSEFKTKFDGSVSSLLHDYIYDKHVLRSYVHNHPSNEIDPSYYSSNIGDIPFIKTIIDNIGSNNNIIPIFKIYTKKHANYFPYTVNSSLSDRNHELDEITVIGSKK